MEICLSICGKIPFLQRIKIDPVLVFRLKNSVSTETSYDKMVFDPGSMVNETKFISLAFLLFVHCRGALGGLYY